MDRVSLSPIDWLGSEAQLFLNPVWSVDQVRFYQSQFDQLSQGEAWIGVATSGTSEEFPKIVLLTRESLLASAQAVVNHLGLAEQDVCLHTLPDFHVGGLGIWARSHLSKCKVVKPVEWEWSGQNFVGLVQDTQATWSSLVPTQVFDLVSGRFRAPATLKGVLVGGGALSASLYNRGRELGWPLLPTYGMSECGSQIATSCLESLNHGSDLPELKLLDHVEVALGGRGQLRIKSRALFKGYLQPSEKGLELADPKNDGWFETSDRVALSKEGWLQPLGRLDEQVKILGELVSLERIQALVNKSLGDLNMGEAGVVVACPDERNGHRLVLVCEALSIDTQLAQQLINQVNSQVLPFERVKSFQLIAELPRTELGKIRTHQLLAMIRA